MHTILKKPLTTEKSFQNQDKGIWTFMVSHDAGKRAIQEEVEKLFGVTVADVNTSKLREKTRGQTRSGRIHTRRKQAKIARIRLAKDSKKLDLTKLKK